MCYHQQEQINKLKAGLEAAVENNKTTNETVLALLGLVQRQQGLLETQALDVGHLSNAINAIDERLDYLKAKSEVVGQLDKRQDLIAEDLATCSDRLTTEAEMVETLRKAVCKLIDANYDNPASIKTQWRVNTK